MAKKSSQTYRTQRSVPSCFRYCSNVCTRLFLFGRQQCINDCLSCRGFVNGSQSKAAAKAKTRCSCKK